MIMALSLPQVVIGATLANAVARPMRWKISRTQESFNVAQYGVAAFAGAGTWRWLAGPGGTLSLRNIAIGALSVLVFAVTSHILVVLRANEALERKTAELEQALALTRATLESTTDGILVTDGAGTVTGFNQKYLEMWRVPRELIEIG